MHYNLDRMYENCIDLPHTKCCMFFVLPYARDTVDLKNCTGSIAHPGKAERKAAGYSAGRKAGPHGGSRMGLQASSDGGSSGGGAGDRALPPSSHFISRPGELAFGIILTARLYTRDTCCACRRRASTEQPSSGPRGEAHPRRHRRPPPRQPTQLHSRVLHPDQSQARSD